MTWQPIETAPRDGTVLKLLLPYTNATEEECTDYGYWLHNEQIPGSQSAEEVDKAAGGCFVFNGCDGYYDIQPTHWKHPEEA